MTSELSLFEAIYTTRAIRKFKTDPIPDSVLRKVLEAAGQAPSGGNRQPWRFIVIRDQQVKSKVSDLVLRTQQPPEGSNVDRQDSSSVSPGVAFAKSLAEVPVIIIVCAQKPATVGPWSVGPFGQTYPAVENLLLAARAFGLGGTITTGYRSLEPEIKDLLGLPESVDSTCLIPLGFPLDSEGERHGKKSRKPIEDWAHEDYWGGKITF